MARIDAPAQVKCFLDLIAWSEGTIGRGDDGYNKIVNPGKFFTDYTDHPNQLIKVRPNLDSTAAGRYQQIYKYWPAYKKQLNLPDFGPESQDRLAIQLIKECNAYRDILDGKIATAIKKCASRWASFPGAGYKQPEHTVEALLAQFAKLGGMSKETA
ncbi:glycoside hydrolase family 24 protein [Aeromonas hydrophila]|uniref:glycoside hydrolase family 24 protein n=1 Tax=Aeromonas hydrophila TaxID=644 RepID=UPI003D23A4B8